VFKVNPNFDKLKFVLAPLSRESMLGCGDVPLPIDQVLEEFEGLFPQGLDTSMLEKYEDKSQWFLDGMTDENKAEILQKYAENEEKGLADATMETLLNRVNNHLPAIEMPE